MIVHLFMLSFRVQCQIAVCAASKSISVLLAAAIITIMYVHVIRFRCSQLPTPILKHMYLIYSQSHTRLVFAAHAPCAPVDVAERDEDAQYGMKRGVKYVHLDAVQYMFWYHLVGLIWISEFILAAQQYIIAGAVAMWYFSRCVPAYMYVRRD